MADASPIFAKPPVAAGLIQPPRTVPPTGPFEIRIDCRRASRGRPNHRLKHNGDVVISNARLFLSSGAEIDGAQVTIPSVAAMLLPNARTQSLEIRGDAVTGDDGYILQAIASMTYIARPWRQRAPVRLEKKAAA